MGQTQAQFAIIGEKKQSFTVEIETANGIEMRPFFGEEIVDGGSAEFIFFGANEAARFVESQVDLAFGAERLAIDSNAVVEGIDFFAQFGYGCAVYGDAAFGDELFAGAPRSHTGIGEELLETEHGGEFMIYELRFRI